MTDTEVRPETIFAEAGPVDWVGKTFFRELGKMLLRALVPDRADGRDWMKSKTLRLFPADTPITETTDFWFDFLADTGDSKRSTYSLAYLLHGDLSTKETEPDLRADRPALKRVGGDGSKSVPVKLKAENDPAGTTLPRGAFLFVGGDTAYPVADDRTIRERFVEPFNYAYSVRFPNGAKNRPVLGIPGNHDWYDSIDGFNRVFRRKPKVPRGLDVSEATKPPHLWGFSTRQNASYFALLLPGNWQLWALDARGEDDVDLRQRAFFRSLEPPERLIVATPLPPVARGALADWAPKLAHDALSEEALGSVKLWYSGDLHHYARYEAVEGLGPKPMTTLVSGLGSAVLHTPTTGPIKEAEILPDPDDAWGEVIRKLVNPRYMVARWGLLMLGAAAGLMLGAATLEPTTEAASLLYYVVPRDFAGPTWTPAPPEFPWLLLTLFVSIALLAFSIWRASRTPERDVRTRTTASRILKVVLPLVIGGILLTQSRQRTFGGVVLDLGFYVALFALLFGGPLALSFGWAKPPNFGQRVIGALLGLTFGIVISSLGVLSALLCQRLLFEAIDAEAIVFSSSVLGGLATMLLFPVITGFFLAGGFLNGAQVMAISSIAAIDRHAAFIRFRLRRHPDGRSALTGFVVSVKEHVAPERLVSSQTPPKLLAPKAEIIDVFTVS